MQHEHVDAAAPVIKVENLTGARDQHGFAFKERQSGMCRMQIYLLASLLLAVLARPAIAAEYTGKTLARVCAGDYQRLCANRVPMPAIEDFREGGLINQCLKEKLNQLSNACWYLIIEGGR